MFANMDKLVYERTATQYGIIIYFTSPANRVTFAIITLLPNNAIVCNVTVSHNKTVVTDNGFLFCGSSAVYSNAFANNSVVTNNHKSVFSSEFHVLWYGSYDCTEK